jgi:hypothetical protein
MKKDYKKQITEDLKDIPEEDLSKIYEFVHWIRFKIVQSKPKNATEDKKKNPLDKAIGCCDGPSDLSENHDLYLYGKEK